MDKIIDIMVRVKVKDLNSAPALLQEVAQAISRESDSGILEKTDGDKITWLTKERRACGQNTKGRRQSN